jgi:hypothetical protein
MKLRLNTSRAPFWFDPAVPSISFNINQPELDIDYPKLPFSTRQAIDAAIEWGSLINLDKNTEVPPAVPTVFKAASENKEALLKDASEILDNPIPTIKRLVAEKKFDLQLLSALLNKEGSGQKRKNLIQWIREQQDKYFKELSEKISYGEQGVPISQNRLVEKANNPIDLHYDDSQVQDIPDKTVTIALE